MARKSFYDKLSPEGKAAYDEQLRQMGSAGKAEKYPLHKMLGLFVKHHGNVANATATWCLWSSLEEIKVGMRTMWYWRALTFLHKVAYKVFDFVGRMIYGQTT